LTETQHTRHKTTTKEKLNNPPKTDEKLTAAKSENNTDGAAKASKRKHEEGEEEEEDLVLPRKKRVCEDDGPPRPTTGNLRPASSVVNPPNFPPFLRRRHALEVTFSNGVYYIEFDTREEVDKYIELWTNLEQALDRPAQQMRYMVFFITHWRLAWNHMVDTLKVKIKK